MRLRASKTIDNLSTLMASYARRDCGLQRRRLLEPLGLKRTIALAPRERPANFARGHTPEGPDDFEPSLPFAAGNIAAPAEDVLRFWAALLGGKVYSKKMLRRAFERCSANRSATASA